MTFVSGAIAIAGILIVFAAIRALHLRSQTLIFGQVGLVLLIVAILLAACIIQTRTLANDTQEAQGSIEVRSKATVSLLRGQPAPRDLAPIQKMGRCPSGAS